MKATDRSRYRAFVSYAHADEKWAKWVQRAIESYRLPKEVADALGLPDRRLRPVFRDSDELGSGPDLSALIRTALSRSRALIVVCSPAARESVWVNREVKAFLALSPSHRERVYCLVIAGDPEGDLQGVLPHTLADYAGLAADPRKVRDGRHRAKFKLISARTGVPLDRLIRRQRVARRPSV